MSDQPSSSCGVVAFCCVEDVATPWGVVIAASWAAAEMLLLSVGFWSRRTFGVAVVGRGLGRWEGCEEPGSRRCFEQPSGLKY